MKFLVLVFGRLARAETGVTSLEYALLASLIGVVIIGSVTTLGPLMDDKFTTLSEVFNPTDDPAGPRTLPPDLIATPPPTARLMLLRIPETHWRTIPAACQDIPAGSPIR